jgi:hypothetical protein
MLDVGFSNVDDATTKCIFVIAITSPVELQGLVLRASIETACAVLRFDVPPKTQPRSGGAFFCAALPRGGPADRPIARDYSCASQSFLFCALTSEHDYSWISTHPRGQLHPCHYKSEASSPWL